MTNKGSAVLVVLSGVVLVYNLLYNVHSQTCEKGGCVHPDWCVNNYNNQSKFFERSFWNLRSVPSDIPSDALGVNLGGNDMTILGEHVFRELSECRILYLYANGMKIIQAGAFSGLINLNDLDLNNNALSNPMATMWTGLEKLKTLNLDRNKISGISAGTFQGLLSLNKLLLADNKIVFLEKGAFAGLKSLTELHLDRNYLSTLDQETFNDLSRPLLITLGECNADHHPILCSSLCWLKKEEEQGNIIFESCAIPNCASGAQWEDLHCIGKRFCIITEKLMIYCQC